MPICGDKNQLACRNNAPCVEGKCKCPPKHYGNECALYNRDDCIYKNINRWSKFIGLSMEEIRRNVTAYM